MDEAYEAPEIIYEGELEVRAGSPFPSGAMPDMPELDGELE